MAKANFKITTKVQVNVRKGPGITFDRVGSIKAWEILEVESVEPDVSGVNWYKIKEGYVCSKFCEVGVYHKEDNRIYDDEGTGSETRPMDESDNGISTGGGFLQNIATGLAGGIAGAVEGMLSGLFGESDEMSQFNRKIFGHPYQFLPTTDIRPEGLSNLGRIYISNILAEAPILSIMPCKPNYLPSMDEEQKQQIVESLMAQISQSTTDLMKEMAQKVTDSIETRYFATDIDFVEYMKYVNLLCRGAALFMDLGDKIVPGTNIPYKEYNWSNWHLSNTFNNSSISNQFKMPGSIDEAIGMAKNATSEMKSKIDESFGAASDALENGDFGGAAEALMSLVSTSNYYIDFYVTPSTSYSETLSNRTEKSKFESGLSAASDMLKELSFFLGSGMIGKSSWMQSVANLNESMRKSLERMNDSESSIFSRLLLNSQAIISGSNIIFPELWHGSERSQSYRAEIKLVSPYGTNEAIFLTTLVPMFHILALTCPRQTTVNSYGSPFLIKAHINKWFSCEMGIIDSCEIQKGGWNAYGFPTEITISLSFKDLYQCLPVSKFDSPVSAYYFAQNQSLLEYMSVLCGLDLKKSEFKHKFDMLAALAKNTTSDFVDNTIEEVKQGAANAAMHVLGALGGGKV